MHAPLRTCLPLALLLLAACSSKNDGQDAATVSATPVADSPVAAANAEFARLQAQGDDATAREFTTREYALTRNLMKAGGLNQALGGGANDANLGPDSPDGGISQ